MKTFQCPHCGMPLFFENFHCLTCNSRVAFLPDRMTMAAMEPAAGGDGLWRPRARGRRRGAAPLYRHCRNRLDHQACNFAVPVEDRNPYCVSCRLTRVLPDLSDRSNLPRWQRIELAKRRLYYTLAKLGLVSPRDMGRRQAGLAFEFLADQPGRQVLTGHAGGLITINVLEADDAERERRRVELHEPYRTLLGHFRHEIGHYYWDVLIRDGGRTAGFRAVFGDELVDYGESLKKHYGSGRSPAGWQERHVSAYAACHPWEDWAETWAHYLHMVDLLEAAASYKTRITLPGEDEGELDALTSPFAAKSPLFEDLVEQWVPITLLVNSLNRSLGKDDAYPFALTAGALRKLRYVHDVIQENRKAQPTDQGVERVAA